MKAKITEYSVTIIGLLLLAAGLCLLKMNGTPQGIMFALPYVCIGIGCGLFGQGMGNIISERAVRSNPEIQKKLEIEKNDERNIAIANRAKGKAYDMRYDCRTPSRFRLSSCSRFCSLLSFQV